jgi:hypothetical protein
VDADRGEQDGERRERHDQWRQAPALERRLALGPVRLEFGGQIVRVSPRLQAERHPSQELHHRRRPSPIVRRWEECAGWPRLSIPIV